MIAVEEVARPCDPQVVPPEAAVESEAPLEPPIDPKVREFLRYVLSREGQDAVQRDGKYLPLTAEAARDQLQKLEFSSP